ncbi:putative dehydrogenase [Paenibacillus cellulosilyticus]|uniref:Putative dehydrogenase n=1 Tax=Paenibacillus cellulosilyticus TaxID=375489 RepID=A0A2V2YS47_9BACL|nr:Gfo/Idh/MocA family oxidoreductase [Paenibacillus cellulosilyticus]PWW00686.1 putative dehydrogenase [Paenibacillus cellulosilyticus]QKS45547.1 Gfo/Idh/MocA family oxidoreductase [Paenibacillus cellulosilyticus]
MTTIRFAFSGFGNIAKTHMTALRALPIIKQIPALPVLDTLITRDPEKNRAQAEAIGFRRVVSTVAEAAADELVQVIDICSPNNRHDADARAAIAGGKAIYCEKPVTDKYSESEALEAAVTEFGLMQQLAFTFRYHPAAMRIRELVREQVVGDILQCKIAYRRSGYLSADRPISWRLDSKMTGGGAISDLGVHALDLFRYWFGDIEHAEGRVHTHVKRRPSAAGSTELVDVNVDDWAIIHLTTSSGINGMAEVSRVALGSDAFDIQIVGTRGSITCDLERDAVPAVHLLKGSLGARPEPSSLALIPDEKSTMGFSVDNHFGALHHFILRLSGDDRWSDIAPTLNDGVIVERWIDRILQSKAGEGSV